jgi:alpha-mannosidase
VLRVTPTELPNNSVPVGVSIRLQPCLELAWELEAARMQLLLARALARTDRQRRLVEKAAACLDPADLAGNRWGRVRESIRWMESVLSPLSRRAKDLIVHVIGHSHVDMDWMWTWPDTVHCIRRDFKAVTDLMDEDPEVTFTHSQVPTYDVVRRTDPGVFAKVRRRVAQGRWENAAATWVEGDLNMADGESIARHVLYATDWTARHLGTRAKVFWAPDTFGHPGNMPQLARLGQFECYYHTRCNPDRHDAWPVWEWTGVDGTSIRAFCCSYGGDLAPASIVGKALRHLAHGQRVSLHVWGLGDHGGALGRYQLAMLARYRTKPLIPTLRFSTMPEVLEAVTASGAKLPGRRGQTYTLFQGCFTTHASLKRYNRRCEGDLLSAETLSAIAGLDRRDALRSAWTDALFNHFHDLMDGAAVHDSYVDVHKRAEKSLRTAAKITREAVHRLARPRRSGGGLTVINPLGFERTGPVRAKLPAGTVCLVDADGKAVPVQRIDGEHVFIAERVPALSQKTWRIARRAPKGSASEAVRVAADASSMYYTVETSTAILRIARASGVIGSYFDKSVGRELVAYGVPIPLTHVPTTRTDLALNVFEVLDESPNSMSAWLIHDVRRRESLLQGAKVTLLETGPVFARFHVEHRFRRSRIAEDVIIYRDLPRVDFEAAIDWREQGGRDVGVPQLKVGFAVALTAARVRTEGPFVVGEIPADGQEMPTQKFADVTGEEFGFALLNDSKYGVDALGGRLRMTLLRNAYGPDPETDNGRHRVRFAFCPHGPTIRNAELVRMGMAFNRPMIATRAAARAVTEAPGLTVEAGRSIVCTAMRQAEHSDGLLVRLFETAGSKCKATVGLARPIASAVEVNFLENPIGRRVRRSRGKALVSFRPFEVKTLLVRCRR